MARHLSVTLAFLLLGGSLTACDRARKDPGFFDQTLQSFGLAGTPSRPEPPLSATSTAPTEEALPEEPAVAEAVSPRVEPFQMRGTGQFVAAAASTAQTPDYPEVMDIGDQQFTLNFVNTDLREVIRAMLEDAMGVNYTIDPRVQGSVTLQTTLPLSLDQVLPTLEEVLRMNGAVILESEGLYRVLPADQAGLTTPVLSFPGLPGQGVTVRVVPLHFVSATEAGEFLQPFAPASGGVRSNAARNLLFVTGTQAEIANVVKLVSVLDVDWLEGMSFALEPLKAVRPMRLIAELEQILDDPAGPKLTDLVRFVPIERMNAVLVVSKQPHYLDEVRRWIARLDQGSLDSQRVHVYYVQNRRAADLAQTLTQVFSAQAVTVNDNVMGLAPGLTPVTLSTNADAADSSPALSGSDILPASPQADLAGAAIPTASGPVRVIADEDSNSLVVLATAEDYRRIEAALIQLDVMPLQVLIEATLVEVTLNDDLEYGVRWFFESERRNSSFTFTDAASSSGGAALGPSFPGFSYVFDNDSIRVTLNALQGLTQVRFLSTPTLLVLDNQTARLQVGDEVPVATQSAVSVDDPDAPIVNSIEFRDTGVILSITPRVNASGLVLLDIKQEVSEVIETTTSGIDSPTIQQRQVESTIALQDSQTVALGGLIQDRIEETTTGVPLLADIPVLGNLFKSVDDASKRTELLVLIKPRVVRDQEDARIITEALSRKLTSIFSADEPASEVKEEDAPSPSRERKP